MSQTTCPGLSLPTRERPLLPASVTQEQCYAPLMAGGLRPLQRKGSMLLSGELDLPGCIQSSLLPRHCSTLKKLSNK